MPVHYAFVALSTGQVMGCGYGDLPDDAQPPPGQQLLRHPQPVPPNAFWDGERFVDIGQPPTPHHVFDYAARQWRFDRERAMMALRIRRDRLLAGSDWVVTRAAERGGLPPDAWMRYRQALRDLPDAVADDAALTAVQWPEPPQ